MKPLVPVSAAARVLLGVSFFAMFLCAWGAVTYSGWVPPLFLASPDQALLAGWTLITEYGFLGDIAVTIWRVVGGFLIAASVGVVLAPGRCGR